MSRHYRSIYPDRQIERAAGYAGDMNSLAEPFERLGLAEAGTLLDELYGIRGATLARLDTERDDSFRVTTASGEFVLKVAHPADDPLSVNLQTAAMSYAAEESGLPLQRVVFTVEGEVEPLFLGRVVRLLTWLPGSPVFEAPDLGMLGATLGRLTDALSTFDHPAAHRDFAWDSGRLDLVRPLLASFPAEELTATFDWFDSSDLGSLPRQVIHNDFHPGNVLIADGVVSGIIDFGDVVYTARVVDLSLALCYFGESEEFVAGFERTVRLSPEEHAVIPMLIAARYAQRILINASLQRGNPDDRSVSATDANLLALRAHLERHL